MLLPWQCMTKPHVEYIAIPTPLRPTVLSINTAIENHSTVCSYLTQADVLPTLPERRGLPAILQLAWQPKPATFPSACFVQFSPIDHFLAGPVALRIPGHQARIDTFQALPGQLQRRRLPVAFISTPLSLGSRFFSTGRLPTPGTLMAVHELSDLL